MQPGELVDGRFEIDALAGVGGMGEVYRAVDLASGGLVAVKVLADPARDIARFEREARILGALDHPNIVRYLGHGTTADRRPFLVIEWLTGQDLATRLEQGTLTTGEVIRLGRVLARGLAAAHAQGVVHRDVKPANIFLVDGRVELAKILDFGVARGGAGRAMTMTGMAVGTPAYMAPEQARGERDVDARADLFSLGCVLFECLAGTPPFVGAHVMAVLAKVLFEEPQRASELRPATPKELDALVLALLAKRSADRPGSATEVGRALEAMVVPSVEVEDAPRAAEPPREIALREQRLLAAVLSAAVVPHTTLTEDVTIATSAVVEIAQKIADIAADHGASLASFADGSSAAVLVSNESASELALRAVRCALALRALRPRAPIAIAIGRGQADARVPTGEVIDRAAALVDRADVEARLRVDDATAGLLGDRFTLRGDARGLYVEAEREEDEGGRLLLGKRTPFVGRVRELGLTLSTLEECVEEGLARAVRISGDAGSGKSRLRHEVVSRAVERGLLAEVWVGRADAVATGAPFGVVASMVRRFAGIAAGEPLEVSQRRLRARIGRHLVGEAVERVTELLSEIVGVPLEDPSPALRAARADPGLFGDQLARAFEDLVESEASAGPLAIVLEDLQWGDGPSIRLLLGALRHARSRPLFVLALVRSEAAQISSSLTGFTQVVLPELSRRAAGELARAVLGELPAPRLEALVTRAAGSPLYLEELLRADASGATGDLPPSVLAMAQARLERLPREPRRMLRAASVFGQVFWTSGVAHLLGGARRTAAELKDWLPVLLEEELIERRPGGRFLKDEELVFRHGLLRDAAYATFTDEDRATGHRLAGEWLESMGERDAMTLGEHFERGLEPHRASQYLLRGVVDALAGHDVSLALELVKRARVDAERDGGALASLRGEIALKEAEVRRWRGEHALAERAATEAMELLERGHVSWYRAVMEALNAAGRRGAYELAIDATTLLEGPARDASGEVARALALAAAGRQLFHAGGYEEADALIADLTRGLAAEIAQEPLLCAEMHRLRGARARHLGDLAEDLAQYRAALGAYERADDARNAANARVSVGFACIELGDYSEARQFLLRACEDAERMGLATVTTRADQNLGLLALHEGRPEDAIALLTRVVQESHAQGNVRFEGWSRVYLAEAHLAAGDPERARLEAEAAADLLEVTPPARAGALAVLSLACVAGGAAEEAELHARGALAILESFGGIEEFEALVWLAAVRAALARGDRAVAAERLSTALARIDTRALAILDSAQRARFREAAPQHAALYALAREIGEGPVRPSALVVDAYDPARFAAEGAVVLEAMRAHLARMTQGLGPAAPPPVSPAEMCARFEQAFPREPHPAALSEVVDALVLSSIALHHPRTFGYQVSAPVPQAALVSGLAALLNSGMAAFESGPAPTAMERHVIAFFLATVPWDRGGGVLTSGGSLGNLTALLAARQLRCPRNVREEGLPGAPRPAILCADQVHYSVERAAQVMGLGRNAVVAVPTDAAFRLDPSAIAGAMSEAHERGLAPFALVASAGSTGTGAVDPLGAIADACDAHGLWLHVDGAHGASALLSARHREALRGIERADSLVWDAHKLMAMPALATAVLFRDARAPYATFAQRAAYLFEEHEDEPWYDIGLRTVECTKPLLAVPLYVCLRTLGTRFFSELVDHAHALAARFAELLVEAEDFELAARPDSNIVCFRHAPKGLAPDAMDGHQRAVRAAVRAEGGFFFVLTTLRDRVWLRTSLMGPLTREADLVALLEAIRAAGAREA